MSFVERSFGPLAVVLVLSFVGCGGTAKLDAGAAAGSTSSAGTSSAGASFAGASANPGGGGGMAAASGGASTAAGASSGGAPSNDICSLPWMDGECEGAFEKYWHNPMTGRCERRTYGGCGGNANRFDTPEQCIATCVAQDPNAYCTRATDCELRSTACCGRCEPLDATDFISVSHSAPQPTCVADCVACPTIDPILRTRRYFMPGCVANRCTVVDIRTTPITECMTSSDCALLGAPTCCQACGVSQEPIAYNKNIDPVAAFCGGEATPCLACIGGISADFFSECSGGRCVVQELIK